MNSIQDKHATIMNRSGDSKDEEWVSPEERMALLMGEIHKIDAQLGDKDRCHADGERMSEYEYWDWRKSAIAAKNYKMAEYRRLKAECKKRNLEKLSRVNEIPLDPMEMLGSAVRILKRVRGHLSPEEFSTLEQIREFMYHRR